MSSSLIARESALSQIVSSAINLLQRADARVGAYFARREAMEALYKLDDRALSDIGVYRGHIERAVEGRLPEGERSYL